MLENLTYNNRLIVERCFQKKGSEAKTERVELEYVRKNAVILSKNRLHDKTVVAK